MKHSSRSRYTTTGKKSKLYQNSGQIIESNSDRVESPLVTVTMLRKMLIIMSLFDDSDAVYYVTPWSERQRIAKCVRIALFELLRQMGGKKLFVLDLFLKIAENVDGFYWIPA